MKLWHRVALVALLLSALGVLFVHADLTEDERQPYPDAEDLTSEYDRYVGERVLVFGTVTDVTDDGLTIESKADGVTVSLRVTDTRTAVEPGGVVQVYGTLEPDRQISAEQIEVVNDSRFAELYKYGASALGALGFLVLFFRSWRIDRASWTVVRRDG